MPTVPVWFSWEQAEEPFSDEIHRYIEQELDLQSDVEILQNCGIESGAITTFRLCHILMTGAILSMAPCNYTLRELGELIVQTTIDEPSIFEAWIRQGCDAVKEGTYVCCTEW